MTLSYAANSWICKENKHKISSLYNEAVSIIYYPILESGSLKQIKLFKLYAKQRMHPLNMDLSCSF